MRRLRLAVVAPLVAASLASAPIARAEASHAEASLAEAKVLPQAFHLELLGGAFAVSDSKVGFLAVVLGWHVDHAEGYAYFEEGAAVGGGRFRGFGFLGGPGTNFGRFRLTALADIGIHSYSAFVPASAGDPGPAAGGVFAGGRVGVMWSTLGLKRLATGIWLFVRDDFDHGPVQARNVSGGLTPHDIAGVQLGLMLRVGFLGADI
jgi:hypothetical protein